MTISDEDGGEKKDRHRVMPQNTSKQPLLQKGEEKGKKERFRCCTLMTGFEPQAVENKRMQLCSVS